MSALGKLLRTTAFQLTLVYLLIFVLFAVSLLGYFALNTRRLITDQITRTVNAEVARSAPSNTSKAGIRGLGDPARSALAAAGLEPLSRHHAERRGPCRQCRRAAARRARPSGLDRNLVSPHRHARTPADHRALVAGRGAARRLSPPGRPRSRGARASSSASSPTPGAGRSRSSSCSALAGGFFVSRRVLNRIDAMTETAQTIMAGDLTGRLPVAGTGDELDRLAVHLNAMLERIEALMRGFKEVSDNIAHDLKTPLTRLRNRCEAGVAHRQGRRRLSRRAGDRPSPSPTTSSAPSTRC